MIDSLAIPIDRRTIVACCTPSGGTGGAVALIRISGPHAIAVANRIFKKSGLASFSLTEQESHTVYHGCGVNGTGVIIDEVLCILMRAPRTFTGEDTIEITCHHNQLIIDAIIHAAIAAGARFAQRGEFTQQAFLNKKIDLIQAEAIHELITAQTAQSLERSLAQLQGSMSHTMDTIEKQLLTIIAWCEASFEFVEEVGDFGSAIQKKTHSLRSTITGMLSSFSSQAHIRTGIRIALLGSVNAGKSSLFNRLVQQERSIVTAIPGTTRDSIESTVSRQGIAWTYIDTAGLRATHDIVEREGIARSWRSAQEADVLLLIIDRSRPITEEEHGYYQQLLINHTYKSIVVYNKSDLPSLPETEQLIIHDVTCVLSATTGDGVTELETYITQKTQQLLMKNQMPFLINQRHQQILISLDFHLSHIEHLCNTTTPPYELISLELQQAVSCIHEVTGKTVSESALHKIFSEFCIGK